MPEQTTPVNVLHGHRPHFVLVPFPAPGRAIPLVDVAQLLAQRGVAVTFVTTPLNAARIRTVIGHAEAAGLPILFLELRLPCAEAGLPEGCESFDLVPSLEMTAMFFHAFSLLREPLLKHLREQQQQPPPSCIISDMNHPWTLGVAEELGVPRLSFNGMCCFPLLCMRNVHHYKVFDDVTDETEPFVVPGLPHRIEIAKAQTLQPFPTAAMQKLAMEMAAADEASYGVVFNSFDEMESSYIERYQEATGKKAWAIGPVCHYNKHTDVSLNTARGNESSADGLRCLAWLDSMPPGSVVYVNFGSLSRSSPSQLREIGAGLAASNHPFAWVIKPNEQSPELEQWLSSGGFEERTKGRGLVVRGWAPQVAILSHPAVGGFVTHCGWNSSLEAICEGVPMVTWPFFAEQFLNERLIVDVLRVGVAVGVKTRTFWMGDQKEDAEVLVRRDAIEEAVRKLMDGGEEGKERRKRAWEIGEKARKAMDVGGSSYENMTELIRDVSLWSCTLPKSTPNV